MKSNMRPIFLFVLTLFYYGVNAQKPMPIYSFATQLQPVSWYAEQSKLWKAEIDKNQSNAYAWYGYYRSTRNLLRLDTTDKRPHPEKIAQTRKIIEDMGKAIPNTFEYNLCKWMFEGNNFDYLSYLKKVEDLGTDRTEHYSDMLGYGEVTRDISKRDKYAKKWLENAPYSPGLMYYNYNVLMGLKANSILVTCGDNDTYPPWLLQAKGIRRDVVVINSSLIHIDNYRNALFKELGVNPWETDSIFASNPSNKDLLKTRYQNLLVEHLSKNTQSRPVYIALTCGDDYTKPIASSLYLTGLAFEYSNRPIDNIALLKKNFEQVYNLDYIERPFFYDISEHYTKMTNSNYVVPYIKLYDHYKLAGDNQKAEMIQRKVTFIVKGTPDEKQTLDYFKQ